MSDFNWDRDYGPLYRACPSAFWLAPEPGERKRDVIDVRPSQLSRVVPHGYNMDDLLNAGVGGVIRYQQATLQQAQISPYNYGLGNVSRAFWG